MIEIGINKYGIHQQQQHSGKDEFEEENDSNSCDSEMQSGNNDQLNGSCNNDEILIKSSIIDKDDNDDDEINNFNNIKEEKLDDQETNNNNNNNNNNIIINNKMTASTTINDKNLTQMTCKQCNKEFVTEQDIIDHRTVCEKFSDDNMNHDQILSNNNNNNNININNNSSSDIIWKENKIKNETPDEEDDLLEDDCDMTQHASKNDECDNDDDCDRRSPNNTVGGPPLFPPAGGPPPFLPFMFEAFKSMGGVGPNAMAGLNPNLNSEEALKEFSLLQSKLFALQQNQMLQLQFIQHLQSYLALNPQHQFAAQMMGMHHPGMMDPDVDLNKPIEHDHSQLIDDDLEDSIKPENVIKKEPNENDIFNKNNKILRSSTPHQPGQDTRFPEEFKKIKLSSPITTPTSSSPSLQQQQQQQQQHQQQQQQQQQLQKSQNIANQPIMSESSGNTPTSSASSPYHYSSSLASSIIKNHDPLPSIDAPNSLEMLQKRAQEVLDSASHGLLAGNLADELTFRRDKSSSPDFKGNELKHRCRYCGKVFGSDSGLQIHIRSHTGERPFKCNVCGSRFTTKGNLKVHYQRHTSSFPHIEMNRNLSQENIDKYHQYLLSKSQSPSATASAPPIPGTSNANPFQLPVPIPFPQDIRSQLSFYRPPLDILKQLGGHAANAFPYNMVGGVISPQLNPNGAAPIIRDNPNEQDEPTDLSLKKPTNQSSSNINNHNSSSNNNSGNNSINNSDIEMEKPNLTPEKLLLKNTDDLLIHQQQQQQQPRSGTTTPMSTTSIGGQSQRNNSSIGSNLNERERRYSRGTPSSDDDCQITSKLSDDQCDDTIQDQPENLSSKDSTSSKLSASSSTTPTLLQSKTRCNPNEFILNHQNFRDSMLPIKNPFINSSLLPQLTEKNDNSWESFISITKHTESAKLQALIDSADSKLSDSNECFFCHRTLSCKSALQMHYRTHTGERPFSCRICDRAFTTKGNLKTHMSVHQIKTPMRTLPECPVCHKRYSNVLVLQQHIRLHTGEQPDLTPEQIDAAEVREFQPLFPDSFANRMNNFDFSNYHGLLTKVTDLRKTKSLTSNPDDDDNTTFDEERCSTDSESIKSETPLSSASSINRIRLNSHHSTSTNHLNSDSDNNHRDTTTNNDIIKPIQLTRPATTTPTPTLNNHRIMNSSPLSALSSSKLPQQNHHHHHKPHHLENSNNFLLNNNNNNSLNHRNKNDKSPDFLTNSTHNSQSSLDSMQSSVQQHLASQAQQSQQPQLHHHHQQQQQQQQQQQSPVFLGTKMFQGHSKFGMLPNLPMIGNENFNNINPEQSSLNNTLISLAHSVMPAGPFNTFGLTGIRGNTTCNICLKTFPCHSALEIHYRSHTKERPFKCSFCSRGFSTKGNMKQHMLTHKIREMSQYQFPSDQNYQNSKMYDSKPPMKHKYHLGHGDDRENDNYLRNQNSNSQSSDRDSTNGHHPDSKESMLKRSSNDDDQTVLKQSTASCC